MSSTHDPQRPGHNLNDQSSPASPAPREPKGVADGLHHLAGAYDSLPAIVAVLDERGVILGMSHECAVTFGADAQRFVGRSILSLAHRDDRSAVRNALHAALHARDRISHCEFRIWRGPKPSLSLSASLRAATRADGNPLVLAACSDITDRVYLEQQLLARSAELSDMANQVLVAEDRERRKIAEDMHDSVGHTLAITKFQLDNLYSMELPEAAHEQVGQIQDLLQDAIDSCRQLVFALNLAPLEDQGLDAAVEDLGHSITAGTTLEFSLASRPRPWRLTESIRLMLYRVIRELLVNVTKHAGARHVRVSIGIREACLLIRVVDDGIGFDVAAAHNAAGTGIRNVRKSLAAHGATIKIESAPGQGSDVQITVPVTHAD